MKMNDMLNIDIDPIRKTYSFLFNFLKKIGSIGVMIVFLILFATSYTLHYFSYIPDGVFHFQLYCCHWYCHIFAFSKNR